MENPMVNACPSLMQDGLIEDEFDYWVTTPEGYRFRKHTTPDGEVKNCQYCKKAGRMYGIFQCINESEWKTCIYN